MEKFFRDDEGHVLLTQRIDDNYIKITDFCTFACKNLENYFRSPRTKKFIRHLARKLNCSPEDLVRVKRGRNACTWVHPTVAKDVIQWASVEFSVEMCHWIEEKQQTDEVFNDHVWQTACEVEIDHNSLEEHKVRDDLLQQRGGAKEVPFRMNSLKGYIDLVTEDSIIEVKKIDDYMCGIGQLMVYSQQFPEKKKVLFLFSHDSVDPQKLRDIQHVCLPYGIHIEFVETSD